GEGHLERVRASPLTRLASLGTLSPLKRGEVSRPYGFREERRRAYPDYRRGRHDRPQAGATAGQGWRPQRPADPQSHAGRRRFGDQAFEFYRSNGNRGRRPV